MTDYAEFRLRVERGTRRGTYRVEASAFGASRTGVFKRPFTDSDLENFVLKVGRTRRGVRRIESPEWDLAKIFGSKLFGALIHGPVAELYREAFAQARASKQGLRITLSLTDVPEVGAIPWEYLFDDPNFLSISTSTPVVRYLDLPHPRPPLPVELPIRILGVISAPTDYAALDTGAERAKLEAALKPLVDAGAVSIEWLEEANLLALAKRLRPDTFQILHYIGHGGFDDANGQGALLLEDGDGRSRVVSGEQLATVLHDKSSLRLVFLNSCEGARNSVDDPFSGVATSLVERDIPAVIGMQFEITDRAAVLFASEFYAMLAEGRPVDAAVTEARLAIFADHNDVEWGTPVLFLRVADGRLFDVENAGAVPRADPVALVTRVTEVAAAAPAALAASAAAPEAPQAADEAPAAREAAEPGPEVPAASEAAHPGQAEPEPTGAAEPEPTGAAEPEPTGAAEPELAAPTRPTEPRGPAPSAEAAAAPEPAPPAPPSPGAPTMAVEPVAPPPQPVADQLLGSTAIPATGMPPPIGRPQPSVLADSATGSTTTGSILTRWRPIALAAAVGIVVLVAVALLLRPAPQTGGLGVTYPGPGEARVHGYGFASNESVTIGLNGTPVMTVTAGSDGTFDQDIPIGDLMSGEFQAVRSTGSTVRTSFAPPFANSSPTPVDSPPASAPARPSATATAATATATATATITAAGCDRVEPATTAARPDSPGILFYTHIKQGESGNRSIYLLAGPGAAPQPLTDGRADETYPAWSPDHTRIAFSRGGQIHIGSLADGTLDKAVPVTFGATDTFPAWSANDCIAFVRKGSGIWRINPDKTGIERVVADSSAGAPDWSPDGLSIAYMTKIDGQYNIYTVVPGENPVQPTPRLSSTADEVTPKWSPDGTKILYARGAVGTDNQDVYVVDVEANVGTPVGTAVRLTDTNPDAAHPAVRDSNPAWSPTGDQIVFYRGPRRTEDYRIWTMPFPAAFETAQQLTPDELGPVLDPAWR